MLLFLKNFHNLTNEARFDALKKNGVNLRFNVITLSFAFFRRVDDPLRAPHIEIAIAGFARLLLLLLSLPALLLFWGTVGIALEKVGLL